MKIPVFIVPGVNYAHQILALNFKIVEALSMHIVAVDNQKNFCRVYLSI